MPKQTFFSLPEEKRKTIEQAALDEFSEYGFDNSNMNRIVSQSKIAKGSFYQYFENKKDLYFHLIDTLVTKKMEFLEPVLTGYQQHPFSHNLRELFRLGLEFAESSPKLYKLGEDFDNRQPLFVREFIQKYNPVADDVYSKLLKSAYDKGELIENINISIISPFISALINQTTISIIGKFPRDMRNSVVEEVLTFIERAVLSALN